MEAHFVYQDSHGGLAVTGVLIEEGAANDALADAWAHLPAHEAPEQMIADVSQRQCQRRAAGGRALSSL